MSATFPMSIIAALSDGVLIVLNPAVFSLPVLPTGGAGTGDIGDLGSEDEEPLRVQ